VSGDVRLVEAGGGAVSRLVRTAATLFAQPGFAPAALVGGLAVTIRLATVHRATNDVDTVSDGDAPRELALEYLGDSDVAASGRLRIDGVDVDVMPTAALPDDPADLPDGELDRLFVLAHRWALLSAEEMNVTVVTAGGPLVVESRPLVIASTAALVACKFHALADRRGARAAKRESDALDLVRLVGDLVRAPDAGIAFSPAPFDLGPLVLSQVDRWFVRDSLRMARLATQALGPGFARIEAADVAVLGAAFTAAARA
jgi:hypothetical protein